MALLSVLGGASLPDGACQSRCFQRPRGKGAAQDRDPNPLLAPALSIEAGTRKIPHHPASNHGCRLFRGDLNRKKDRPPGATVLGRGWQRLASMSERYESMADGWG